MNRFPLPDDEDRDPSPAVQAWRDYVALLTATLAAGREIARRNDDIEVETYGLEDLLSDARAGLESAEDTEVEDAAMTAGDAAYDRMQEAV